MSPSAGGGVAEVVERFERAERALRRLTEQPVPTDGATDVAAWAEETMFALGEISEWIAEAWERVAIALEAAVGPEVLAPRADELGEPSAEDVLATASFLDDIVDALDDEHDAA